MFVPTLRELEELDEGLDALDARVYVPGARAIVAM